MGYIKVTKIDPKKCKHGTLQNERNFGMKTKKCGENDLRQGMKKPKVFLNTLMKIKEQNHIMNEIKLELKAYQRQKKFEVQNKKLNPQCKKINLEIEEMAMHNVKVEI